MLTLCNNWYPKNRHMTRSQSPSRENTSLENKVGLIVGVANEHSIGAGCARALSAQGASLALTYLDDKAKPYAQPVADETAPDLFMPLDVTREETVDAVFAAVKEKWGRLDFLIHSIAFCNRDDLHGRVVDVSAVGFAEAMDVSCHSFLRLAARAEPLMTEGGCLLTVSFLGAERVVPGYGIMGPIKAALEASVRYMAEELGPKNIRVNALSPGPIRTRAASGLSDLYSLIEDAESLAPIQPPADIDETGAYAAFLVSDAARAVTGAVQYIDGGYNLMCGQSRAHD